MMSAIAPVDSPERMIAAIRKLGIVPLFHNSIRGWSIEELTADGYWFGKDGDKTELGPWDWKIDAVREGDIAYGKFIRNKAAFATSEFYGHLMNWRRSLPQYRVALGEDYPGNNLMDRLNKLLSPVLLDLIKENGSLGTTEIRKLLQEKVRREDLMKIGGSLEKYLVPNIKRTAVDYLNLFLEMGTFTLIGDFERVYKGPNLEYSGWQRCSITTPEAQFSIKEDPGPQPFWAKFIGEDGGSGFRMPDCTPRESRDILIERIHRISPETDLRTIEKVV